MDSKKTLPAELIERMDGMDCRLPRASSIELPEWLRRMLEEHQARSKPQDAAELD